MANNHNNRILCDVDGTLTRGPGNSPTEFAPLNDGVRQFLGALKDRGYQICVFSARSPVDAVKMFFKNNDLDRYVDEYSRSKKPARLILDDRVVPFEGDFDVALGRIDRFKPWWDTANKYSCAMAVVPDNVSQKVLTIGSKVADEDLAEDGREKEIHITVLYGITEDSAERTRAALLGKPPASVTLGKLSLFEIEKGDVLHIEVDSPDLHDWNAAVRQLAPHIETYPEYKPHITVAHVKSGKGKKYLELEGLSGEEFRIRQVTFSDRSNSRQQIFLD